MPGLTSAATGNIDRFAVYDTFTHYFERYSTYESFYALGLTRVKLKTGIVGDDYQSFIPTSSAGGNADYLFQYVSNLNSDDVRRDLWETISRTS